jgi:DNA-binding transcriptional LysR family regulator
MARDLFATLDLNLLKTLSVLAQERNMRRASERLFVTQPAVSQTLKKLRHHFGDELFVKTHTGLQPTSFTIDLVARIEPVLDDLSRVLNEGEGFDPSEIDYAIRIALAPHMSHFLSRRLFKAIRKVAPLVEIHLDAWSTESLAEIAKGDLLLGINAPVETMHGEVSRRELADDYFTAYVREDHPGLKGRNTITLKDLDGIEIASLILPDFNTRVSHVERLLKSNGYRARVGFRSSQPSAVTDIIRSTDMVYGASSYIESRDLSGLRALDVKINNQYLNYPVTAYFHRKHRKNPLVLWLQDLVRELLVN